MKCIYGQDIVLPINDLEYLVILLLGPLSEVSYFDQIPIAVHTKDHHKYIIQSRNRWLLNFLNKAPAQLNAALVGKLHISTEMAHHIGLKFVQSEFNVPSLFNNSVEHTQADELWHYMFLDDRLAECSWLYQKDSIYLEVTPGIDPAIIGDTEENKITFYTQYAARYQTLAKFQLTSLTINSWLEQISSLREICQTNYDNAPFKYEPIARRLDSLDICKHHDLQYGTDPLAHAEFVEQVKRLQGKPD